MTYSFVPDLVWLPAQLAKLSDREGSHVQTLLQALSRAIYRLPDLPAPLRDIVEPIWNQLPERADPNVGKLPNPMALNYFEANEHWFARRARTLSTVLGHSSRSARSVPEWEGRAHDTETACRT